MICILSTRLDFRRDLKDLCDAHGVPAELVDPKAKDAVSCLYHTDIVAAVVDSNYRGLPEKAWFDLLASLGRRIPVIVIGREPRRLGSSVIGRFDAMSWLKDPKPADVLALLEACGAVSVTQKRLHREQIPIYNPQMALHMLQNYGALSMLVIDASNFRKISIDYGVEVYHQVQHCLNQILLELWGNTGSFRAADVLCRRTSHGNTYFIFLEKPRVSTAAMPAPGILERQADRLSVKISKAFWREICVNSPKRLLPECISVVPDVAVGYATTLYNPCFDALDLIEQLIDQATEASHMQLKRMRDRQRELMQTLIHTPGLLAPHYQAVFHLPNMTKDIVAQARTERSLVPLAHLLYGFESLIRVMSAATQAVLDISGPAPIDVKYMRPDVLFALAFTAKVGLELDQACLNQAVLNSRDLPGTLLINILPRNLYNIDRLRHLLLDRRNLMFEVSESEAINNLELMFKVRVSLERMHIRIAADDFGRGYSGLEQIIKIKPDLIKLDRSLITDIHLDEPKQAFVNGLLRAAKISGSTILAEGVETWDEAEILQSIGIDLIQGYLLHKPQAPDLILEDLRRTDVSLLFKTVA